MAWRITNKGQLDSVNFRFRATVSGRRWDDKCVVASCLAWLTASTFVEDSQTKLADR